MPPGGFVRRPVLFSLLLTLGFSASAVARDLSRDALWQVVRACVTAQATFSIALPCLEVTPDKGDTAPGVAVMRSPWSRTHVLVVPTRPVIGIEAPVLQTAPAETYWQAAIAARRFVVSATRDRIRADQVGLAVNAKSSRTQDQLHIHVDCARADVLSALRTHDREFTGEWRLLHFWVDGTRFFGLRLSADEMNEANLFARLMRLPGYRKDLASVAVAVFSAGAAPRGESFYVLATWGPGSQAERLLDHACILAGKPADVAGDPR
jgi:CDP-diacylglycerol pyrophosphatase